MSVEAQSQARAAPIAPPKISSDLVRRQTRLAWMLLAPSLLVVALVAIVPLMQTIYQSFTDARLASARPAQWVGLRNYQDLLTDGAWWHAVGITVAFTIITVIFEFVLGMIIALVVNSNFKGRGPMRAAMLVPCLLYTSPSPRDS